MHLGQGAVLGHGAVLGPGGYLGKAVVLAHGVGGRADLPVPIWLAAVGAGLAVLISFAGSAVLYRSPRPVLVGVPLSRVAGRVIDSTWTRPLLRSVTLVLVVLVCVIGLAGPADVARNVAPWALYVTFWVGVLPASLILGPVWKVLNPLRGVHAVLARLLRLNPECGRVELPVGLGYWPGAVSLGVFAWLELVYPAAAEPAAVGIFVIVYSTVHLTAAVVYGRRWFDRGDGFEAYSTLLGSLSVFGRRDDGRLVLRSPLAGLAAVRPAPGLVAIVVVLVGSTAYDGLARTLWWREEVPRTTVTGTAALLATIMAVSLVLLAGTWATIAVAGGGPAGPEAFAHTIVPIAAGYALAHYFSLLVLDGQRTWVLASDPFGRGADLFGTATWAIDYTLVGPITIALIQVGGIVAGHVVATVAAHERALGLFPVRVAIRTQYPLLLSMIGLTVGAVGLVFAA